MYCESLYFAFIFICILSAFQELQMLASSRQPNFVTFTGGNLSLGDIFFPCYYYFLSPLETVLGLESKLS